MGMPCSSSPPWLSCKCPQAGAPRAVPVCIRCPLLRALFLLAAALQLLVAWGKVGGLVFPTRPSLSSQMPTPVQERLATTTHQVRALIGPLLRLPKCLVPDMLLGGYNPTS